MMTRKEKKKFYTRALYVVIGILAIPMLMMLVGGGKSHSSVSLHAQDVENVLSDGDADGYPHIRAETPNDPTVHERLVAEFGHR